MGRTQQRGTTAVELGLSGGAERADSIGRFLSRERKVREISLDELARSTRLPRRTLERLEAGSMDGERDGFSRGLVRTVAEALGLSVDDALARMLPEAQRGGGTRVARRMPSLLRFLAAAPPSAWLALLALLVAGSFLWIGVGEAPPEPLLYRRDAVRELWLLQQQRSTWSPAPALATSPAPTVEPESPAAVEPEANDRQR